MLIEYEKTLLVEVVKKYISQSLTALFKLGTWKPFFPFTKERPSTIS